MSLSVSIPHCPPLIRELGHRLLGLISWNRWNSQDSDTTLRGGGVRESLLEMTSDSAIDQPLRTASAGELYASLFEKNHSVMLVIDPDSGSIVDANPAACSFYGYNKSQITQMRITEINILAPHQVHEEMQRARTEERSHFEFRHSLATGEIRDVEVYCSPIIVMGKQLLYSIIHDVTERLRVDRKRQELIVELREARNQIKTLTGILPVCSYCKRIRDDEGNWDTVDTFLQQNSSADVSHSLCPECEERHYD